MGQQRLSEALRRLRAWPFPMYVAEHRERLYDEDLDTVLEAAERHLKETA